MQELGLLPLLSRLQQAGNVTTPSVQDLLSASLLLCTLHVA